MKEKRVTRQPYNVVKSEFERIFNFMGQEFKIDRHRPFAHSYHVQPSNSQAQFAAPMRAEK